MAANNSKAAHDPYPLPLLDNEPLDPRPGWKAKIASICDGCAALQELLTAQPDEGRELLARLLAALDRALRDAFVDGRRREAEAIITDFDFQLQRSCVGKAHALRRPSAHDEVKAHLTELEACGWRASECEALREMLKEGERITAVTPRVIETTSLNISRTEVRVYGRPSSWVNDETWNSRFTSDEEISRLEAQRAAREAASTAPPSAGPRTADGQSYEYDANDNPKRRW
jgi:hypothetical protein